MLLSTRIISYSRCNLLTSIALHQFNRRLIAPISSHPYLNQHLHFHQKCSAVRSDVKTGLLDKNRLLNIYQHKNHLLKFIHGQRALHAKEGSEKNIKDQKEIAEAIEEYKKLGLIARFKKMTKEYWYVLIPVHCFTSCFWFGGFYYASIR